mmetsp:Transcript_43817/g.85982  ORF Transcript_43817/g.85982 Transcript_43817/m.85982 type:complete len:210 (-) Transcript_43817:69-698(-)
MATQRPRDAASPPTFFRLWTLRFRARRNRSRRKRHSRKPQRAKPRNRFRTRCNRSRGRRCNGSLQGIGLRKRGRQRRRKTPWPRECGTPDELSTGSQQREERAGQREATDALGTPQKMGSESGEHKVANKPAEEAQERREGGQEKAVSTPGTQQRRSPPVGRRGTKAGPKAKGKSPTTVRRRSERISGVSGIGVDTRARSVRRSGRRSS